MKKENKRASQLWAFDTEDNSRGVVSLINFYDGEEHHTFRNQKDAIEFLSSRKSTCQFWATNLGYDLVNLFGDQLSLVEITYIQSRVISAKISGTQIHFRDTLNHWKISVAEMGARIGLQKIDAKGNYDNVEYCQRDTEITWNFVNTMKGHYEKIGCKLKATIGSTSLQFYQDKFGAKTHTRFFKKSDIEFMLRGYYGGRTEIFFNKPVSGRIYYHDFNSLYPAEMAERTYPSLAKFKRKRSPDLNGAEGIVHARVRAPSDLLVPYLPFRSPRDGSLLFPLGVFKGHWTYFEIREALKIGYTLERVYTAIEFTQGSFRPFETYVKTLYDKRLEAQKEKDDLLSDSYKLLMNNLYGKFAQGNEILKLLPFERSKLKHGDTLFGSMVLRKQVSEYPAHTNVIWSAYVTAYGRHKLWLAMQDVIKKGGLLIYCDTDSIIYENKRKLFKDEKGLGKLKLEGQFTYAHFKLPKLYRLDKGRSTEKVYRAKGVPRKNAEEFFESGRARFERPYKLKETLRRNLSVKRVKKLIPNFWDTTEKEVRKIYDKRIVEKTGHTRPIQIVNGRRDRHGERKSKRISDSFGNN